MTEFLCNSQYLHLLKHIKTKIATFMRFIGESRLHKVAICKIFFLCFLLTIFFVFIFSREFKNKKRLQVSSNDEKIACTKLMPSLKWESVFVSSALERRENYDGFNQSISII